MDTRVIATQYRMKQWAQIIQERQASGESVKSYCQNRGLSRVSYYHWQRKLREAAGGQLATTSISPVQTDLKRSGFAEVMIEEPRTHIPSSEKEAQGSIHIEASGLHLSADSSYPAEQLAYLLRELVRQC